MNGYPDDIRRFDNDPRSPFYKDPMHGKTCVDCEHFMSCEDDGRRGIEAAEWELHGWNVSADDDPCEEFEAVEVDD